jgi:ferric-dicitrate binding protein FerR (iron transport regulator)
MEIRMQRPDCPDHGTFVLDLALGRLEDERADHAERVRESCPSCSAWWQSRLSGRAVAEVDEVVAEVFEAFRPPARRKGRLWLAAAAVVLIVTAGLLWRGSQGPSTTTVPSTAELVQRAFEGGETTPADLTGDGVLDAADLVRSLRDAAATN